MSIDEMIAVLQAAKEGKRIECRGRGWDTWHGVADSGARWNFEQFEYRVKPEPREIWVAEFQDSRAGTQESLGVSVYNSPDAMQHLTSAKPIRFREVID